MKKSFFLIVFTLIISQIIFSNEYESKQIDFNNSNESYCQFNKVTNKLDVNAKMIFMGSILLSELSAESYFLVSTILSNYYLNSYGGLVFTIFDIFMAVYSIPNFFAGLILTIIGNGIYRSNKKSIGEFDLSDFYKKQAMGYKKLILPFGITSGVIGVGVITGVILSCLGQYTWIYNANKYAIDNLAFAGITLDIVFGSLFCTIFPILIASISMTGWMKYQLSKLTPELTLAHDSKKDFDEGYSVRMGLRVRI